MDIREAIAVVSDRGDLSTDDAIAVFSQIMDGEATEAQIAAFIVALRMKGETVEEITGAATVMRDKATAVTPASTDHLVDTCGTGGDRSNTFNISTAAAFVAAGAGARVAKHGNRSVTSRSGSADVLEALGVDVTVDADTMTKCLDEVGVCFMFAPTLHKAMKHAMGPRRQVGIRTIFNILGPLTNPARAQNQLLGVFAPELTESLAEVLRNMGSERAYVIHGMDPLDEVSLSAETRVCELRDGEIKSYTVSPEDFGMQTVALADVQGGTAEENAALITSVLEGNAGPHADIVALNAGFAVAAAGLADTPKEGLELAREAMQSGAALDRLRRLSTMTAG